MIKETAKAIFDEYIHIAYSVINSDLPPDQIIGDNYLRRWWLAKIPGQHREHELGGLKDHTRKVDDYNLYLHCFTGSDDDRALHDHPSNNVSMLLLGRYREHTPIGADDRQPGDIIVRRAEDLHRIELIEGPVWSLFIMGPKTREWGFMCEDGWTHWRQFEAAGCD